MSFWHRLKRLLLGILKVVLSIFLLLVLAIGCLFGVRWINSHEDVSYVWDDAVEHTSATTPGNYFVDGKHRGVSLMAEDRISEAVLAPMIKNNIEWVAVHPYLLQTGGLHSTELRFEPDGILNWGIHDPTLIKLAGLAKEAGMHIFLKPHLWLSGNIEGGKWRSDIEMKSEADWPEWFEGYTKFILHYAVLADSLDIEMFSVGTELQTAALQREADWRRLIAAVREVYDGKLIYSANWHDEYEQIKFWDALDAIGVQAYFPLTDQTKPAVEALVAGWSAHKTQLKTVSDTFDKPVIFTEIGYKSVARGAIHPWEWETFYYYFIDKVSVTTQANAFEAFFKVFWDEPWFQGAYIWRWHPQNDRINAKDRSFYIQNKPAQNVVARGFMGKRVIE